jgi:hypothetical protein
LRNAGLGLAFFLYARTASTEELKLFVYIQDLELFAKEAAQDEQRGRIVFLL